MVKPLTEKANQNKQTNKKTLCSSGTAVVNVGEELAVLAGGVGGVAFGAFQEALIQHLGGGGEAGCGVLQSEPPGVGAGLRETRLVLLKIGRKRRCIPQTSDTHTHTYTQSSLILYCVCNPVLCV